MSDTGNAKKDLNRIWQGLVDNLVYEGVLSSPRIIEAFRARPRYSFVREGNKEVAAMVDRPVSIGEGATVSQPMTVATMLELVSPQVGEKVLDIGTGSGWQAVLLGYLVGEKGKVYTIERISRLQQEARKFLSNSGASNVVTIVGNGTSGYQKEAPFDVIVCAAQASYIPPALLSQLAPGGRLLQPITDVGLRIIQKDMHGNIHKEDIPGFVFVPLIEEDNGAEHKNEVA